MSEVMKAKMGQVFICTCCAKAFSDRKATQPVGVEMSDCVVGIARVEPHPKYPDDPELAKTTYQDITGQDVVIPEAEAGVCCPTHTVLCNAARIRFRRDESGVVSIVGAEHLE